MSQLKPPPAGALLSGHLAHLPLVCQQRLSEVVQSGALGPADLDPKLVIDLCSMPEAAALVCVERFLSSNLFSIRNKSGFMVGVINRFKAEVGPEGLKSEAAMPPIHAAGHGDPSKTVHVGNLPREVGDRVLEQIFGCIGALRATRVAQELSLIHI